MLSATLPLAKLLISSAERAHSTSPIPQRPTVHLDTMTVKAVIMLLRKTQQHSPVQDDTLAEAAAMPPGTFGHAWGQFMGRRKFTADERPPVRMRLPVCLPAFLRLLGGSLGA